MCDYIPLQEIAFNIANQTKIDNNILVRSLNNVDMGPVHRSHSKVIHKVDDDEWCEYVV